MGHIQKKEIVMPLLDLKELEGYSSLFRGRLGKSLASGLMKMLSVDRLNDLYERNMHEKGPEFAASVLSDLGVERVVGYVDEPDDLAELLPEGPFITISNHPYGHIDGITLVDLFGHIRPDYKVMVNRILGRVESMQDNFIQVTPVGESRTVPTADSVSGVKQALRHLRSGGALGLFPSGAVSDLSLTDGTVRDRDWQDPVIKLIAKASVPVLPVRFFDGNSSFYYSLGLLSWKIRLLRLPAEVFNKKGKPIHVGIGPLVTVEEQKERLHDLDAFKSFLRTSVYDMSIKY